MISDQKLDLLENSKVSLKITIAQDQVQKEFDGLLNEYSQKAQIKGFRRGKVPVAVLKQKFGPNLEAEAMSNLIQKSLEQAFTNVKHKPLPYTRPELKDKPVFNITKDFSFEILYDTYPIITLPEYRGIPFIEHKAGVTDEDIERELKELQNKNSYIKDKEDDTVERGDVVTIDYGEVDNEGNDIDKSKREGFVFEVGTGYNLYKIDEDILGLKRDEEKIIDKKYAEDYEYKELAARDIKLRVKIKAIKQKVLPKIDDELAQDVSEKYKTLNDLKAGIRLKLENLATQYTKNDIISQVLEVLVKEAKIDLPQSMIDIEFDARWRRFILQHNTSEKILIAALKKEGKSKEDIFKEWLPDIGNNIKNALIREKIIQQEKIEVSEEEITAEIKKYADTHNISVEKARKKYEEAKLIDTLKNSLKNEKFSAFLVENSKKAKSKKVKFLDLLNRNY